MATTKKTSTKESTVEETTSNKVTKFQKQLELSHSQIKGKRAAFLNEEAEVAMRRSVDSMKDTLREYRREEMALEDFYPTSTMTLNVTKEGFDVKEWSEKLINIKIKIKLQEEKVKISQTLYADYFTV